MRNVQPVGSTPIRTPAKDSESALSSPGDHVGSAGLIDTQDLDDIRRGTLCVFREQIISVSFSFLTVSLMRMKIHSLRPLLA